MIIRQVKDAVALNRIVNDPGVRTWVSMPGQGPLDLSEAVSNPLNVLLMDEQETMAQLWIQHAPGFFEVHTQALPCARGKYALKAAREFTWFMFTRSVMTTAVSKVPTHNAAARQFARAFGPTIDYSIENGWPVEGGFVRAEIYRLDLETWAKNEAPRLEAVGQQFHSRLNDEYRRIGKPVEPHAHDEGHDRIVGLVYEMIANGAYGKGIKYWNKWAPVLGLHRIRPMIDPEGSPLRVDIGTDILKITPPTFEVVSCQSV